MKENQCLTKPDDVIEKKPSVEQYIDILFSDPDITKMEAAKLAGYSDSISKCCALIERTKRFQELYKQKIKAGIITNSGRNIANHINRVSKHLASDEGWKDSKEYSHIIKTVLETADVIRSEPQQIQYVQTQNIFNMMHESFVNQDYEDAELIE